MYPVNYEIILLEIYFSSCIIWKLFIHGTISLIFYLFFFCLLVIKIYIENQNTKV